MQMVDPNELPDINHLAVSITSLDPYSQQLVYLIVMLYSTQHSLKDGGIVHAGKKGVKINLQTIPSELCLMLQKFVQSISS